MDSKNFRNLVTTLFSECKANLLKNKISSPDTIEADVQGFPDFKRILELLQKAHGGS